MSEDFYKRYTNLSGVSGPTREYRLWVAMKSRIRTSIDSTKNGTYFGCSASAGFLDFQFFADWCNRQSGFMESTKNNLVWQLDKDLLVLGNKEYSEDNCVFIPAEVNQFLKVKHREGKHAGPVGVTLHKRSGKWYAQCRDGTRESNYRGSFESACDAFSCYKKLKEEMAKKLADKFCQNLDNRAYDALYKYEVGEFGRVR